MRIDQGASTRFEVGGICGIMNIFDFSLAFNVNFESVLSLFNIIQT